MKKEIRSNFFFKKITLNRKFYSQELGGILEPPTTPIGRDELAMKRHRFFSDLINAAKAATEHRVCFDPLGPFVTEVFPAEAIQGSYIIFHVSLSSLFICLSMFACLSYNLIRESGSVCYLSCMVF